MAYEVNYFYAEPTMDNNNILFSDLVNIVPRAHPFTGLGHRRNIDITRGDKEQHWFDKRPGLKKLKMYTRKSCTVTEEESDPSKMNSDELERYNWEFTDSVIHKWTRFFLRVNQDKTKLKIYVYYPPVREECSDFLYWDMSTATLFDITAGRTWVWDEESGQYKQKRNPDYLPFDKCCYDRFLLAQGPQVEPFNPSDINNDPQSPGRHITSIKVLFVYYNYNIYAIAVPQGDSKLIKVGDLLHFKWTTTTVAAELPGDMAEQFDLPKGCFLLDKSTLTNVMPIYTWSNHLVESEDLKSIADLYEDQWRQLNQYNVTAYIYDKYGESLYFVTTEWLNQLDYWIDDIPSECEWDNECDQTCNRISYHTVNQTQWTDWSIITWLAEFTRWSIALLRSNWTLWISMPWTQNHVFPITSYKTDLSIDSPGMYTGFDKYTDLLTYYWYLVMIWGHDRAYFTAGNYVQDYWAYKITDKSGYFNPRSRCLKDGMIHVVRSYWDLYYAQAETWSYTYTKFAFAYESKYLNSHLRNLNHETEKCYVDMTDNNSYITIHDWTRYEKDSSIHYSKMLIQDRQYNFWYTWLIKWARVSRVIDNLYLWDLVYANVWERDWWSETEEWEYITEIISGQRWDQTSQGNKHIVNNKILIGNNSRITNDTIVDTNILCDGKWICGSDVLTNIRYPNLLWEQNAVWTDWKPKVIKEYLNGEQIYSVPPEKKHNFQNEMEDYKSYYTTYRPLQLNGTQQDMDLKSYVARFSPITIPIQQLWADADVIQFTISAQKDDRIEFGGWSLGYYENDFDRTDIANTVVHSTDFTYGSENLYSTGVPTGDFDEQILQNNFS